MPNDNIIEDATAGSTSASSIAVNTDTSRHADHEWRKTVKDDQAQKAKSVHIQAQLKRAKELKDKEKQRKKGSFTSFFRRKIAEDFDMGSVVSQLKGLEHENGDSGTQAVSYGIEDDKGNFMRVTVRSDQAKEFEMTIARKMADNKDDAVLGLNTQRGSLAEILFDLQNEFDIMDVEFPIIPKDAVYNAGDATVGQAPVGAQTGEVPAAPTDMGMDTSLDGTAAPLDGTAPIGGPDMSGDMGMDASAPGADTGLDDGSGLEPEGEMDADNVESFGDETASDSDPSSLLKSLVDMLKKQAEAETAKANADAERSRASQAEWSAISANKEVERQEELARVEADLEEKKRREKMSKQYADIAKYNVTKGKGMLSKMGESEQPESFLYAAMLEDLGTVDDNDPTSLQKAKQEVMQKYQVNPDDSNLTKNYKASAMRTELSIINSKIQLATLTQTYNKQNEQQQQQQTQNQPQQQNQPTQQAQPPAQGQQAQANSGNGGI